MDTRERIISMIDKKFKNRAEFERAAGLSPQTVNDWERKSQSYFKCIPLLARILETSSNYLLCETDNQSVITPQGDIAKNVNEEGNNMGEYLRFVMLPSGKRIRACRYEHEGLSIPSFTEKLYQYAKEEGIIDDNIQFEAIALKIIEDIDGEYGEGNEIISAKYKIGNDENFHKMVKLMEETINKFFYDEIGALNSIYAIHLNENGKQQYSFKLTTKSDEILKEVFGLTEDLISIFKESLPNDWAKLLAQYAETAKIIHEDYDFDFSRSSFELDVGMKKRDISINSLAKIIRVEPVSIHSWLSGERTPNERCKGLLDSALQLNETLRLNEELDRLSILMMKSKERLLKANEETAEIDEALELVQRLIAI